MYDELTEIFPHLACDAKVLKPEIDNSNIFILGTAYENVPVEKEG